VGRVILIEYADHLSLIIVDAVGRYSAADRDRPRTPYRDRLSINETPMLEPEHFEHLNDNIAYIRREDW
jgi:hypothetical protein